MESVKSTYKHKILVDGEDYPHTYREFVTMFFDDKSCREYLYKLRWKDGFICPKCKSYLIHGNKPIKDLCVHIVAIKLR